MPFHVAGTVPEAMENLVMMYFLLSLSAEQRGVPQLIVSSTKRSFEGFEQGLEIHGLHSLNAQVLTSGGISHLERGDCNDGLP